MYSTSSSVAMNLLLGIANYFKIQLLYITNVVTKYRENLIWLCWYETYTSVFVFSCFVSDFESTVPFTDF